jgi:hypothetical protein
MHSLTDYFFVLAVVLPPVALAIGFLIVASPHAIERAERAERDEQTGHVTAKAH